jgi:hypothetical protein
MQQSLGREILNWTMEWGGAQRFGSKRGELLIDNRDCFARAKICDQSKLLSQIDILSIINFVRGLTTKAIMGMFHPVDSLHVSKIGN